MGGCTGSRASMSEFSVNHRLKERAISIRSMESMAACCRCVAVAELRFSLQLPVAVTAAVVAEFLPQGASFFSFLGGYDR